MSAPQTKPTAVQLQFFMIIKVMSDLVTGLDRSVALLSGLPQAMKADEEAYRASLNAMRVEINTKYPEDKRESALMALQSTEKMLEALLRVQIDPEALASAKAVLDLEAKLLKNMNNSDPEVQ